MLNKVVSVITGANRGIGLEFVKQNLNRTKGRIIACCRNPEDAEELYRLKKGLHGERIKISKVDVSKQESINEFCKEISKEYDRVDYLINVAGILHDNDKMPERNIREIKRDWLIKTIEVNTAGPLMMTQGLYPFLRTRLIALSISLAF